MRLGVSGGLQFVGPKIGQQFAGGPGTPPADPSPAIPALTVLSPISIQIDWIDNSSDEIGFKIERAEDAGFTVNLTTVVTTAANIITYIDTGLTGNTTYYYRITAIGISTNSNVISLGSATTLAGIGSMAIGSTFIVA